MMLRRTQMPPGKLDWQTRGVRMRSGGLADDRIVFVRAGQAVLSFQFRMPTGAGYRKIILVLVVV